MSRSSRTVASIALVAIISLLGAACGDDGDASGSGSSGGGDVKVSDDAQPYVDAMKTSMRNDNDSDDLQLTDDQIDCLAPRWVDTIGVERFEANDITPEDVASETGMEFTNVDITEDEGNKLYDSFGDCGVNLRDAMMESMAADDEMSDAAKACMESAFTDENLRTLMVTMMVKGDDALEDDPAMAPLMGQLMGCAFMSMGEEFGDGFGEGSMTEDDMSNGG